MEHEEVYGRFVLTVYVFDPVPILYFCKQIAYCKKQTVCLLQKTDLFTVAIIENVILSCFNFCESLKWKEEQIVFINICKVK